MAGIVRQLWRTRRAVTALEYALIGALVAVAIIAGAATFGSALNRQYAHVAAKANL